VTSIRPPVTSVPDNDDTTPDRVAPLMPRTPDEVLEVVRRVFPGAEVVAVWPRRGTPEP
jgi:hypothetical protein